MDKKQKVYQKLDALGITYNVTEHPAVFTIEDMEAIGITAWGEVCKNLFVRDQKGNHHYLIVLQKDKKADLTKIATQIDSTRLSFASPERLEKYLGLEKGSVSPLGVINDTQCDVKVIFDRELKNCEKLGFHPNDNTATLWISFDDLEKVIKDNGNSLAFIKI